MVLPAKWLRYQSRALGDVSVNLPGHSDGRICVVPEAGVTVWEGGGTEEQCAPAAEGGKWGRKQHGREKIFLIPFCPVLAQSNVCFAMFAIFSKEKSCLSFLVGHIGDIYYIYTIYTIIFYTIYISIILGMEFYPQILLWHDMQEQFSNARLHPTFRVLVLLMLLPVKHK